MANREEVFNALREVLVDRLKVEEGSVTEDANLFEDLGLDSIDLTTVVMALEEKYGVEVSDDELENVTTLREATELLSEKVTANA
jgi:acyl carrier protein